MQLEPGMRKSLEPLTHNVTEAEGNELALASIAISLKRIADVLERGETRVLPATKACCGNDCPGCPNT